MTTNNGHRGRPVGGGQIATKEVVSETIAQESRCKVCGCTDRSNYFNITTHEHDGVRTEWKTTKCLQCEQLRRDIFKTKIVQSISSANQ